MSFLIGGVYGDLKEYGGNVAQCVCCLMCSGPLLIVLGLIFFVASFSVSSDLGRTAIYIYIYIYIYLFIHTYTLRSPASVLEGTVFQGPLGQARISVYIQKARGEKA